MSITCYPGRQIPPSQILRNEPKFNYLREFLVAVFRDSHLFSRLSNLYEDDLGAFGHVDEVAGGDDWTHPIEQVILREAHHISRHFAPIEP